MEVMHERVAGLDVHKAMIVACVRIMAGVVSRRRESAMLYGRWRWTLRSRFVGRGFKPP
jgi:hypothetical protein